MSLKPTPIPAVPEETARVARAVFPRGNALMQLRDTLGTIYTDEEFADLFPTHGQPAEAPCAPSGTSSLNLKSKVEAGVLNLLCPPVN